MKRRSGYRPSSFKRALRWTSIVVGSLLAVICLAVAGLWLYSESFRTQPADMAWGVTYSAQAASGIGLDPRETFHQIVTDLKPQRLRLVAYWTEIEKKPGIYDYADLDYQVKEAEAAGIPYTIAVGRRVPRYPECFTPAWAKKLSIADQQQRLMTYVSHTVARFNTGSHLTAWQVENEPFLASFGICPKLDEPFLKSEVASVRNASGKPIVMTDSGESSLWLGVTKYPDVFGTTLYRAVINSKTGKTFHHIWTPSYYRLHAALIRLIHPNVKRTIIAELQAEPWAGSLEHDPKAYLDLTMDHKQYDANIKFAQDTGMSEVYMWGVEWWYFEKQRGDSYYWDRAARQFSPATR